MSIVTSTEQWHVDDKENRASRKTDSMVAFSTSTDH
jgi:hypothetical protein